MHFPSRPGRVDTIAGDPYIGFSSCATPTPERLGAAGRRTLRTGTIVSDDPREPLGTNAARHLMRTDSFVNAPDLLVNGFADPKTGKVTPFEELAGCHGGLGGEQSRPFLLNPLDLELPSEELIRAETVHRVLKARVPHS